MLRAEILAAGVREELPQPLVNAAAAETGTVISTCSLFSMRRAAEPDLWGC